MEFIAAKEIKELSNPGVVSRQLLNPENSISERVTITEVHLVPGACQPRHIHETSEQIWYMPQKVPENFYWLMTKKKNLRQEMLSDLQIKMFMVF